ncbi:MAG: polysaccharide deacetylase family protein [Bacteroidota bacterium]
MAFKLLIVNYHYFRDEKPSSGIYPVSSAEFISQLDALSRRYIFCGKEEIVKWIKTGYFPDGKFCLITFDDGLREQMEAVEILVRKGIPGIFFVPVGPYLDHAALPVHKLHFVRSVLPDDEVYSLVEKHSTIASYAFDREKLSAQYRYDNEKARRLKYFMNFVLSPDESDSLTHQLFLQVMDDEKQFATRLYMQEGDLVNLSRKNMLGSHGTRHKPLATLSSSQAKHDIAESIKYLEELTQSTIDAFAYPYGSKAAVPADASEQFAGTSIEFAFTMFRGLNTEKEMMERFFLKRVDTNDAPGGKSPLPEFQ